MSLHPIFRRFGSGFTEESVQLIVHGQGVVLFNYKGAGPCVFNIFNKDKSAGLKVEFTFSGVNVTGSGPLIDKNSTKGLSSDPGAYYWFSLDSQNQKLYAGVGEARLETVVYQYEFPKTTEKGTDCVLCTENKSFLESLVTISLGKDMKPLRLLRDPVTLTVPMVVRATDELTMSDVAAGTYLPSANLSTMNQKLYNCVSGRKFILDDADFPDFSKAIEHSIATPGLWCNTKLKEKSTEFSKDKPNPLETYLRITLGQNNGESPGIPYVMEIWPVGHYSPVHGHAGADAIIRVLYGNIHVRLFPFLSPEVVPFSYAEFKTGEITWISPTLNQVHQLTNLKTSKTTCITIQCYMYEEADKGHYDYFDYIDPNGVTQQYEPDSDMDFVAFKALMKREWLQASFFRRLWSCFA